MSAQRLPILRGYQSTKNNSPGMQYQILTDYTFIACQINNQRIDKVVSTYPVGHIPFHLIAAFEFVAAREQTP